MDLLVQHQQEFKGKLQSYSAVLYELMLLDLPYPKLFSLLQKLATQLTDVNQATGAIEILQTNALDVSELLYDCICHIPDAVKLTKDWNEKEQVVEVFSDHGYQDMRTALQCIISMARNYHRQLSELMKCITFDRNSDEYLVLRSCIIKFESLQEDLLLALKKQHTETRLKQMQSVMSLPDTVISSWGDLQLMDNLLVYCSAVPREILKSCILFENNLLICSGTSTKDLLEYNIDVKACAFSRIDDLKFSVQVSSQVIILTSTQAVISKWIERVYTLSKIRPDMKILRSPTQVQRKVDWPSAQKVKDLIGIARKSLDESSNMRLCSPPTSPPALTYDKADNYEDHVCLDDYYEQPISPREESCLDDYYEQPISPPEDDIYNVSSVNTLIDCYDFPEESNPNRKYSSRSKSSLLGSFNRRLKLMRGESVIKNNV
jgi:hypothetical protein